MNNRRHLIALAACAGLAATAPRIALAGGSCCLSAGAFGVGRLVMGEVAAAGLNTGWSPVLGNWNADGDWAANPPGVADHEWRTELYALTGDAESLQLFAAVPWVVTSIRAAGESETAAGIGDMRAGFRWDLIGLMDASVAGVALLAGAVIPTGTAPWEAAGPLGADATGRGAWAPSLGVAIERAQGTFYLRLEPALSIPLPATGARGESRRLGQQLDVAGVAGAEIFPHWLLSAVARYSQAADVTIDGERQPGTGLRDVALGAALAWTISPYVTLQAGITTGVFVDGLGRNLPGLVAVSTGARFGFY